MQEEDFSFQNDMQLSLLNSVNNDYTQEAIKLLENEKVNNLGKLYKISAALK
ncbi:MAG: hypothetical protein LIO43_03520 [Clostridiales bacterium]|nr:hypothetical protein [Clostridiales bacterium]